MVIPDDNNYERFQISAVKITFKEGMVCTVRHDCSQRPMFKVHTAGKTYRACREHVYNVLMEGHIAANPNP